MSLGVRAAMITDSSFPRVSGDEPATIGTISGWVSFSPRERG